MARDLSALGDTRASDGVHPEFNWNSVPQNQKSPPTEVDGLSIWSGWLDDFRTFWLDAEEEVEAVKVSLVLDF